MAFITIIALPEGGASSCTKYFYRGSAPAGEQCFIRVGEVAEVPDSELDAHLATGKVVSVAGLDAVPGKRRGRPPKQSVEPDKDFAAIYSARRDG